MAKLAELTNKVGKELAAVCPGASDMKSNVHDDRKPVYIVVSGPGATVYREVNRLAVGPGHLGDLPLPAASAHPVELHYAQADRAPEFVAIKSDGTDVQYTFPVGVGRPCDADVLKWFATQQADARDTVRVELHFCWATGPDVTLVYAPPAAPVNESMRTPDVVCWVSDDLMSGAAFYHCCKRFGRADAVPLLVSVARRPSVLPSAVRDLREKISGLVSSKSVLPGLQTVAKRRAALARAADDLVVRPLEQGLEVDDLSDLVARARRAPRLEHLETVAWRLLCKSRVCAAAAAAAADEVATVDPSELVRTAWTELERKVLSGLREHLATYAPEQLLQPGMGEELARAVSRDLAIAASQCALEARELVARCSAGILPPAKDDVATLSANWFGAVVCEMYGTPREAGYEMNASLVKLSIEPGVLTLLRDARRQLGADADAAAVEQLLYAPLLRLVTEEWMNKLRALAQRVLTKVCASVEVAQASSSDGRRLAAVERDASEMVTTIKAVLGRAAAARPPPGTLGVSDAYTFSSVCDPKLLVSAVESSLSPTRPEQQRQQEVAAVAAAAALEVREGVVSSGGGGVRIQCTAAGAVADVSPSADAAMRAARGQAGLSHDRRLVVAAFVPPGAPGGAASVLASLSMHRPGRGGGGADASALVLLVVPEGEADAYETAEACARGRGDLASVALVVVRAQLRAQAGVAHLLDAVMALCRRYEFELVWQVVSPAELSCREVVPQYDGTAPATLMRALDVAQAGVRRVFKSAHERVSRALESAAQVEGLAEKVSSLPEEWTVGALLRLFDMLVEVADGDGQPALAEMCERAADVLRPALSVSMTHMVAPGHQMRALATSFPCGARVTAEGAPDTCVLHAMHAHAGEVYATGPEPAGAVAPMGEGFVAAVVAAQRSAHRRWARNRVGRAGRAVRQVQQLTVSMERRVRGGGVKRARSGADPKREAKRERES